MATAKVDNAAGYFFNIFQCDRADTFGIQQVGFAHIDVFQYGVVEVCALQVGMSEAGILESGVIQVGMDKLGSVQDGFCKGGMMLFIKQA